MEGGIVQTVWRYIGPYVFPQYCVGCKKEGEELCAHCRQQIPHQGIFFIPTQSSLTWVYALGEYQEGSVFARIIYAYKYRYMEGLVRGWQWAMEQVAIPMHQIDVIVPVPLHRRRHAERGFNQVDHIAQLLSAMSGISAISLLKRSTRTKQQARLSKDERMHNVAGAFSLAQPEALEGKRVLIVDDIYTTGATMGECARVLTDAGAQCYGFVLGRGM